MTNLIVNAIDVLGEEVTEGVVSIAPEDIQYSTTAIVLPDFQQEELDNGQVVFENVEPGRIVVQFYWGINRTATVRVTVPDTDTATLSSLILQSYDADPAVVSQVTKAAADTEQALAAAGGLREITSRLAGEARQSAIDSEASNQSSEAHKDGARAHREAAEAAETRTRESEARTLETETRTKAIEEAAAGSAQESAASAQESAEHKEGAKTWYEAVEETIPTIEGYADAAEASHQAAAGEHQAAEQDRIAASTSATKAANHETQAEAHRDSAAVIASNTADAVRAELDGKITEAEGHANRSKSEADRAASVVDARVSELVDGAPEQFDTLKELAEGIMANEDTVQNVINGLAGKADKAHTHEVSEVNGLEERFAAQTAEINKKANSSHKHEIAEVNGLDEALAARSADGHKHTSADITDTTSVLHASYPDRLIRTRDDGQMYVYTNTIKNGTHVTNKSYVDGEVGKKADTEHKHTSADITDLSIPKAFSLEMQRQGDDAYWTALNRPAGAIGANQWQILPPAGEWRIFLRGAKDYPVRIMKNGGSARDKAVGDALMVVEFDLDGDDHILLSTRNSTPPETERLYVDFVQIDPGKADKAHTHTSADISDSTSELTSQRPERLVATNSEGTIHVHNHTIGHAYSVTNKSYVDEKKWTSADIVDKYSGVWTTAVDNRLIATSGGGYIQTSKDPVSGNDVTNKRYVDSRTSSTPYADSDVAPGTLLNAGNDGYLHSRYNPTKDNHLARKAYVDAKADEVMEMTQLGKQNLNAVTIPGFYYQNANADAAAAVNYPADLAGYLEVWSDGNWVHQRYTTYQRNDVYIRTRYGSTWYSWRRLAMEDDVNNRTPAVKIVGSLPSVPDANTLYIIRY